MGTVNTRPKPALRPSARAGAYILLTLSLAIGVAAAGITWYSIQDPRALSACEALTCLNGGFCEALDDYNAVCVCAYGFLGSRCEVPGCAGLEAEPPQTLWNQTVLQGANATGLLYIDSFIAAGGAQRLWLVYAERLVQYDPSTGQAELPVDTAPGANARAVKCLGGTLVSKTACSGSSSGTPCVQNLTDSGSLLPVLTADVIASALGSGTSFAIMQLDCTLAITIAVDGAVVYFTRWQYDLVTLATPALDITMYVPLTSTGTSVVLVEPRLYIQTPDNVTWIFTSGVSLAAQPLVDLDLLAMPTKTDVAATAIVSMTSTDTSLWVVVQFRNWTTGGSLASFTLYHFGAGAQPLITTGVYLPLIGGTLRVYGSASGDLYLSNGDFVARQTCNGLAPAACPGCGSAATCQGLTCQCLYPYFNGTFPVCLDVDECSSEASGSSTCAEHALFCMNYDGGYACHTSGAVTPSWMTVGATLTLPEVGFGIQTTSFSPVRHRFMSKVLSDGTSMFFYSVWDIRGAPDDREFIVSVFQYGSYYDVGVPGFHITDPDLAYTTEGDINAEGVIALYNVMNGSLLASVGEAVFATGCASFTGNWLVGEMIRQDSHGTIWLAIGIYSGSERIMGIIRLNGSLANSVGCYSLGAVAYSISSFCYKTYLDLPEKVYNCFDRPYTNRDIHEVNADAFLLTTVSTAYFPNYTLPSAPIITGTGPFGGDPPFDSPATTLLSSTSSNSDGSTLNILLYPPTAKLPRILYVDPSGTEVLSSTPVVTARIESCFDSSNIYTDYAGGALLLSTRAQRFGTLPAASSFRYGADPGLMFYPDIADGRSPCATANGGCGGQFCVQTATVGTTRCDVCDRFTYPRDASSVLEGIRALDPAFVAKRLFSDPFLRGPDASQQLFVAGTASILYAAPPAAAATAIAVPVAFPPFGFAMSQDTHASIIYVAAATYSTTLPATPVIASVNYLTGATVNTLSSARLNFTFALGVSYTVRGFAIDRTRVVWVICCASNTTCYVSKWYANLTLIALTQMPGGAESYLLSTFTYDRKTLVYTTGRAGATASYRFMGGCDYAPQRWTNVVVGGAIDFAVGPAAAATAVDSTQYGFVAMASNVTFGLSVWESVQVYDRFGYAKQTVPIYMKVQDGTVLRTDVVVQLHFSGWGELYFVTDVGSVGVVGCAVSGG